MRFKKVLVTLISILFVVTMAANAMATLWSIDGTDMNIIITDISPDDQYAIFDSDDLASATQIYTLHAGGNQISASDLNSDCFDFAWFNPNTQDWDNNYNITSLGSDMKKLEWFGNSDQFFVIDAKECNPVPIPAAGYLLVAGMAGLISTRKFKKH